MPPSLTLARRQHPLSNPELQRAQLACSGQIPSFSEELHARGLPELQAESIRVLQVNLGKRCNQTCRHCHVDAGPERTEIMSRETMQACLDALDNGRIGVLDITGGAPEMNPDFRWFVEQAKQRDVHAIDRCNLTILLAPGFNDLPEFLARHRVEIVASLPCYLAENTNAQRGSGVHERSIEALRVLNALGYGQPDSGLDLSLVYNPLGPTLPPDQANLEAAYRHELRARFGVEFTRLYTITNMPISRFLEDLADSGHLEVYMQRLLAAFNPSAVSGLMCRSMLSVGWDGKLYDCDFNQMLSMPLAPGLPTHIRDVDFERLSRRSIVTDRHCFGCSAGSGSSCGGVLVS